MKFLLSTAAVLLIVCIQQGTDEEILEFASKYGADKKFNLVHKGAR
jgi:hypothetical protein